MPVARVGDINLCYNVRGDGQPLIVITGFASTQTSLFGLARALAKHYRVVTLDNRGIGGSDKPTGPYSMSMMAGDTIGLMDYLGVEKAHIMGGSMGGMIAQEMAIDYPQRLDKLILFSTSANAQWLLDLAEVAVPNWNRSRSDIASADLRKLIGAMASRTSDHPLYRLVLLPLATLQVRLGRLDGPGPVGQLEAMMTHNVLDRLHLIQAPTLVLTGSKDRLIPSQSSEALASRITGAKLISIDGGSHVVAAEKYGRFKKEVLGFLRGG
jgi:pimeloyl-ACP methyl ester carboxylesterase